MKILKVNRWQNSVWSKFVHVYWCTRCNCTMHVLKKCILNVYYFFKKNHDQFKLFNNVTFFTNIFFSTTRLFSKTVIYNKKPWLKKPFLKSFNNSIFLYKRYRLLKIAFIEKNFFEFLFSVLIKNKQKNIYI